MRRCIAITRPKKLWNPAGEALRSPLRWRWGNSLSRQGFCSEQHSLVHFFIGPGSTLGRFFLAPWPHLVIILLGDCIAFVIHFQTKPGYFTFEHSIKSRFMVSLATKFSEILGRRFNLFSSNSTCQ